MQVIYRCLRNRFSVARSFSSSVSVVRVNAVLLSERIDSQSSLDSNIFSNACFSASDRMANGTCIFNRSRPWFQKRVSFINTLLLTPRFDSSVLYFSAETTSILVGSKAGRRGDLAMRPPARTSGCAGFARSRESNVRSASSVSFFQSLTM